MKMKCAKCGQEYESETYPCSCPKCHPKTPTYVFRDTMPESKGATFRDHAEELLARFPGVDLAEVLIRVTACYQMDFRYGNKREERAACDFLNLVQEKAVQQIKEAAESVKTEHQTK